MRALCFSRKFGHDADVLLQFCGNDALRIFGRETRIDNDAEFSFFCCEETSGRIHRISSCGIWQSQ